MELRLLRVVADAFYWRLSYFTPPHKISLNCIYSLILMQLSIVCFQFLMLDFVYLLGSNLIITQWLILEPIFSCSIWRLNCIYVGCLKLSHHSLVYCNLVSNFFFYFGVFFWYFFTSNVKSVNPSTFYVVCLPKGVQVYLCACGGHREIWVIFLWVPPTPHSQPHLELTKCN